MDPRLVRKKMLLVMPSRMAAEIISGVIQSEAAWEVVGWTKSVSESVASARELKADGVLVDGKLADGLALDVVAQLNGSGSRVVILLDRNEEFALQEAEKARVHGIVDRSKFDGAELIECLRIVLTGRTYWSPAVHNAKRARLGRSNSPGKIISDAERRVLCLIARGLDNEEIGEVLKVSSATIRTHRGRIMRKLSIPNTPLLIRAAFIEGLVPGLDSALIRQ